MSAFAIDIWTRSSKNAVKVHSITHDNVKQIYCWLVFRSFSRLRATTFFDEAHVTVWKMRLPSVNTRWELAVDVFGRVRSFKVSLSCESSREINVVTSIVNFDYQLFADEMTIRQICVGNLCKNQIQINSRDVMRDLLCAPVKIIPSIN